ncbi:MAG TPA: SIS domain-containing protein [Chloroflexota bacterium]|nr:SIS domain-containing protein [Chloroflexota bacterium]
MTGTERDILSTPEILRQTLAHVAAERAVLAAMPWDRPVLFLGCGSSYWVGVAAASLYERQRSLPAQALFASDYRPRPEWLHLAISRTGQTTEVVEAMRLARAAGAPVALLVGERGSAAEAHADAVLHLPFAPERGIVQTRFISAALTALRVLIEEDVTALAGLPEAARHALDTFDPAPLSRFDHVVFLGRAERYGLARLAGLNLQETALLPAEGHQTLDYRHGPIALAAPGSLVWCFDPASDAATMAVLDDVRRTGATVHQAAGEPLLSLIQAQLVAVRQAERRGLDPDAPRHLSRAVVLASSGDQFNDPAGLHLSGPSHS